jgi:putative Mn2+ efflux pump MntP
VEIFSIFFIGIGLSMDAFSLSLCYSALNLNRKKIIAIALSVGIFHFFMPLIGMFVGNFAKIFILPDIRIVVYTIFMLLGVEMIYESAKKEENIYLTSFVGIVMFSFFVSIDSFSAGIGINFISSKYILCSFIFSLTSSCFTYVGLNIGKVIVRRSEKLSKIIGGLIFILFALYYLFR